MFCAANFSVFPLRKILLQFDCTLYENNLIIFSSKTDLIFSSKRSTMVMQLI